MWDTIKEGLTVTVKWLQRPKTGWFGIVLLMTAALVTMSLIGWLWVSKVLYAIAGFTVSTFYGFFAIEVFTKVDRDKQPPVRVLHQMWFNFLCSVVGWLAGYYVFFHQMTSSEPFRITDILLLLVAVIGMTGYLPMTAIEIPRLAVEWLKRKTGDDGDEEPPKEDGADPTNRQ